MNLLELIVTTLDAKKANNIVTVDFKNENPLFDYFVIADAPSLRQINALTDDVIEAIEKAGFPLKPVVRENDSTWILIDAIDVVVHIFLSEEREHYSLEKLYQEYIER